VAGKEYKKRACCKVGQNVPSDSCPAENVDALIVPAVNQTLTPDVTPDEKKEVDALIIVICVLASIIVVLFMGVFLSRKKGKKAEVVEESEVIVEPEGMVEPVVMMEPEVMVVPVLEGGNYMINSSKTMEQYPGASAPPPPVNPQYVVQESVRVN
jgi:hypothetical protein